MKINKATWLYSIIAGMAVLTTGCVSTSKLVVNPTQDDVIVNGQLNEPSWKKAKTYSLVHPEDFYKNGLADIRDFFAQGVADPGQAKLLYDKNYLYIGFELKDGDLIAEATKNQQNLCGLGDCVEVFLKPVNATYYWEIHLDPLNHTAVFFYRGRGTRGLPSALPEPQPLPGLKTAITVDGSVNMGNNKDHGWTAELAIPLKQLNAKGIAFTQDNPWTMLLARYNYSCLLPEHELSAYPQLPFTHFHDHQSYGTIRLKD